MPKTGRRGKTELLLRKLNTRVVFERQLDLRSIVGLPKELEAEAEAQGAAGASSSTSEMPDVTVSTVSAGAEACGEAKPPAEPSAPRSLRYELYAVLVHSGSLEKGHYFALIRNLQEGDADPDRGWYRFNDEKVSALSPEQVGSTTPQTQNPA